MRVRAISPTAMAGVLRLTSRRDLELAPTSPFHFDATMHKPDHFPSPDNAWAPGVRWQTMRWRGEPLGLRVADGGTRAHPRVLVRVWSRGRLPGEFMEGLAGELAWRWNLELDLRGFNARFASDPQIGPVLRRWRGMRPASWSSLYEYLVIAIVLQNAVVHRSIQMMRALLERYGTLLRYGGRELYGFWDPADLDGVAEEELRALKVGYRARSIVRVTEAFARGGLDEIALRGRPEAEQREALLGLYGIGPASAGYILSDVFHRLGPLTHIPPWEQRIYSMLFLGRDPGRPVPADRLLRILNRRFGEHATLAVHYAWEDLFWRWRRGKAAWLDPLIRR